MAVIASLLAGAGTSDCKEPFPSALDITVTAVIPATGPLAGGTNVTITGTNFIDVTSVTIGGAELGSRTVVSATEITGTTPAATGLGATDVVVTSSSHGRGTCSGCFRYVSSVPALALAVGGGHTCALSSSGRAYCWGANYSGQLGNGSTRGSLTPVAVSGPLSFDFLGAGGRHTCGLTSSGTAYCWGNNGNGQLGNGSTGGSRPTPGPVAGDLRFIAIVTGEEHTCGLTRPGTAYCWGWNEFGQLGTGSTTRSSTPVAVAGGLSFTALAAGSGHTCGLTSSGAAHCWGYNASSTPVAIPGGLSFSVLSAGGGYTCGLTSSGAAYCWGSTPIAVPGGLRFSALAAGGGYTCGLSSSGAAYCWGDNSYGQLGSGSTTNSATPVVVAGGLSFSALAAGRFHTCGFTTAGAAYCWGDNSYGQLGDGAAHAWRAPAPVSGTSPATLVTAGRSHTCALASSGAASCWGANGSGQLGDGSTTSNSTPVAVSGGINFRALAASRDAGTYSRPGSTPGHTCGLTSSGTAYCWGDNYQGQLGIGSKTNTSTPVAVAEGLSFIAIVTGTEHTCGLASSGAAYCWGDNSVGQLGTGSRTDSPAPVAVVGGLTFSALATGFWHTCGLTSSGAAYCWGDNSVGQLGLGTTTGPEACWVGHGAFECSTVPEPVVTALRWESITAGDWHTCAITPGGQAYCWGWNSDGQLGTGSITNSATPVAVSGGLSFSALAAGLSHSCGLTSSGMAYCWGWNSNGQLGTGSTTNSATPVVVSEGLSFSALAAGSVHTCGLTTAGAVYCWGDNYDGQLGRGTFGYATVPVAVAPFAASGLASAVLNARGLGRRAPLRRLRTTQFPWPSAVGSRSRACGPEETFPAGSPWAASPNHLFGLADQLRRPRARRSVGPQRLRRLLPVARLDPQQPGEPAAGRADGFRSGGVDSRGGELAEDPRHRGDPVVPLEMEDNLRIAELDPGGLGCGRERGASRPRGRRLCQLTPLIPNTSSTALRNDGPWSAG